jgi:hypothetical protein
MAVNTTAAAPTLMAMENAATAVIPGVFRKSRNATRISSKSEVNMNMMILHDRRGLRFSRFRVRERFAQMHEEPRWHGPMPARFSRLHANRLPAAAANSDWLLAVEHSQ